ncbi:unnamed protein product [Rotaria sp. Silwood2]|nr:unnamed protein product [Rotaria sp. Silwood2]
MSIPHFREITECRLSEDYDHEAPIDLNSVRFNAHQLANQQLLLTKINTIDNWDKPDIEFSHCSSIKNELFREIALMKLLINENTSLSKTVYRPLLNKTLKLKTSFAQKYFLCLNSNQIWTLMCKKSNCKSTFYQCLDQSNETIFGFRPLDGECYTKFKILLWPCIMDYYQVDIHTLPSISRYNNNFEDLNKFSINISHSAIKLFSIVAIRNLNNCSFQLSSNDYQFELLINKLVQDIIIEYQGQYLKTEQFTKEHLQILANSMIDYNQWVTNRFFKCLTEYTVTNDQYPRGLYISSDESLFIWLMGTDHFRIISLSTTLNVLNVCKTLNTYLMFIDNYLNQQKHSFAFHSKFSYLTSKISELSGLIIIVHCRIFNEYYQKLLENQLEKFQKYLIYAINPFESSTIIIKNKPLLGLNENEKLLRTIYAILIVLHNIQEKFSNNQLVK